MATFQFDQDKLIQAALETGASPLSIEEGTGLAEFWIERGTLHDARVVAVECGFVMWLDEWTVIVGVQDLLTSEPSDCLDEGCPNYNIEQHSHPNEDVIIGNEWKTTKESTKYWNEGKWLDSITEGSQIAIYALALQSGTYYPKVGEPITPGVIEPKIRVKAVSKSYPPVIWPRRDEEGIITFSETRLVNTRTALLSKAAAIRAMRKLDGPWQVCGIWCTNQFKRVCEHHADCVEGKPHPTVRGIQESDPAFSLAVPHIPVDKLDNPELVILSASAYGKVCECPEAYRRSLGGRGEESMAMGTGTVFHSVVACSYRQLQDYQQSGLSV